MNTEGPTEVVSGSREMGENAAATHIKVILPLIFANLLQDGQILLFYPIVFGLFPIYRLLFFHVVMVQVLVQVNVLLPVDRRWLQTGRKTTGTCPVN